MQKVNLTIDGTLVEATEGITVLEAARAEGIYIPTLCADPDLEPYGGCRLCLVEIDKMEGLPASCTTPVAEGMVVRTETPGVQEARQRTLELLLTDHPDNCLVCSKNQHCDLQKVAAYVGIDQPRFKKLERQTEIDSSNPFFVRDSSKCILCGKCVRVCNEIQGLGALEVMNNGLSSKIITSAGDIPILESICESCGQCVAKCPTGALMPKNYRWASKEVSTVCPYCGVGCGTYLAVRGNEIVGVRGDPENPANKGSLCVKGQFGFEFVDHPDRLTSPLIRRNGRFVEASFEEALDLIASKLNEYKGDQFAAVASARITTEDNYVIQKLARAVMATNNIDHCARL